MRLIIRPNSASVAEWVSRYVVKRIKDFAPTAEVRLTPSTFAAALSLHEATVLILPLANFLLFSSFTCIVQRPFVLGLPTGSTPLRTYEALIRLHKNGEVTSAAVSDASDQPFHCLHAGFFPSRCNF
jgi:glucosamine-6-phosphate deaminase